MDENGILKRYGLWPEAETPGEYAAIEERDGAEGGIAACRDILEAIEAARDADDGQTLNPWFSDRQVAVINSYMDGEFGSQLLTAREDPAHLAYGCDALLAHLVAACDPEFPDWEERLSRILGEAENPVPEDEIRDVALLAPPADDGEILSKISWTRGELRDMLERGGYPDASEELLRRFAQDVDHYMLEAVERDIDPSELVPGYEKADRPGL